MSVADEEIRMERYEVVTVQLSVTHRGEERRSEKLWRNTESLKENREIRGTRDEGRSVKFEDPVIRNTGYDVTHCCQSESAVLHHISAVFHHRLSREPQSVSQTLYGYHGDVPLPQTTDQWPRMSAVSTMVELQNSESPSQVT